MTTSPAVLRRRAAVELERTRAVAPARPKLRPWIVFTITVVIAFFGLISSRISLDRSAFELEELEKRITQEEARTLDLEVEVARLQSPARIDRLAQDLGLAYPDSLVVMDVPDVEGDQPDPELRIAQLDRLLTAQP